MATMIIGGEITGVYSPVRGMAASRRPSLWNGATPEVFFAKRIDNSRVVKLADPKRAQEIRQLVLAGVVFFAVFLVYSWQHFRSIEHGYRIEAQRIQRDKLMEENRELNLEVAGLRDPQRIDVLARKMGLQAPNPGQFVNMEPTIDQAAPVFAKVMPAAPIGTR
jgi:cell division protein FtsL